MPSTANQICNLLSEDKEHVGTWEERFGFKIRNIALEHIEWTEKSKELVAKYNESKMSIKAYEGVTEQASNIAAQQKIAEGIKEKGLGEGGAGMIIGMNMAQGLTANPQDKSTVEKQVEVLKNLKELLDAGVLTNEEFEIKKKEVLGL